MSAGRFPTPKQRDGYSYNSLNKTKSPDKRLRRLRMMSQKKTPILGRGVRHRTNEISFCRRSIMKMKTNLASKIGTNQWGLIKTRKAPLNIVNLRMEIKILIRTHYARIKKVYDLNESVRLSIFRETARVVVFSLSSYFIIY